MAEGYEISLRDLPVRERPAVRLAELGTGALSAAELIAAIVGGDRQLAIAHSLLARFKSFSGVAAAGTSELMEVIGIGQSRAAAIQAAAEWGQRVAREMPEKRVQVRSPADAASVLMGKIGLGIGFLAYNMFYSSIMEYLIKPRVIGEGMQMNSVLVFIGIIGGIKLFGILGIIYGPLIITIFLTLAEIYRLEYKEQLV